MKIPLVVAACLLLPACGGADLEPATPAAAPASAPPPAASPATAPPSAPAAAATAPPPPLGVPLYVTAIEDWANTVCACTTLQCASDAAAKIVNPSQNESGTMGQYLARYSGGMAKGQACATALRTKGK